MLVHSFSRFGTFLLFSAAAMSAGCTGSQRVPASPPAATLDRGGGHDGAPPRDEELSTARVLDRASFVRAVLRENPTIEAAKQAYRGAVARTRQSGAFEDPMVDLGVAPLSIGSSSAPFGFQVGVSQRLPWFGKRALERSVAALEAEAAKSDIEATRRDLALGASLLYDQYFLSNVSHDINGEHIRLMTALRAGAVAQFEAGRGSLQDPLQAEAELAELEREALVLSSETVVTMAQMNELLHRDPGAALPPPPKELPILPIDDLSSEGKGGASAEGRPEVASARLHARAEQARAERAEREGYPDFTVSASYNSMWEMPEHRFMVGLGFNLPIQAGRRTGAAEEAEAARARYEAEAARAVFRARTEIAVAKTELTRALTVVRHYEERALPVARRQIDAARAGFVASQNPFVAVVEAERNLRRVELAYQMARADCDRLRLELDRALGRVPGLGEPGGSR